MRAARALAALEAAKTVGDEHLRRWRRRRCVIACDAIRSTMPVPACGSIAPSRKYWDDGRARLVRCGDRGAVVRGRSGRHRWRSGPIARRPGTGSLADDAARGIAVVAAAETSSAAYCRWTPARRARPQCDPARREGRSPNAACWRKPTAACCWWRWRNGCRPRRRYTSPRRWMRGRRSSSATGFRCGCRPGSA